MSHRSDFFRDNLLNGNGVKTLALFAALAAGSAYAQPTPAPSSGDAPCAAGPTADTVASVLDKDGYYSLMDGTSFKGWWQSCQTGHSSGTQGGIFRVASAEKAFYLTQRGSSGGILMTNKKFDHYELVFDYWTDFGNDGGIFHRTPANGNCMQTVLDYIQGASLGGVWGEGRQSPISRDWRPFSYSGGENSLSIPGKSSPDNNEKNNWTTLTQKYRSIPGESFDCPASGCTQAEWRALWDMDGWNQVRLQFYGGIDGGNSDPIKMKSWFRKVGAPKWVPILFDTNIVLSGARGYPANHIGLQIHGGGRFGGPKGAWYRNIKWRALTASGQYAWPTPPDPSLTFKPAGSNAKFNVFASSDALMGMADLDHEIVATDVSGKIVETFSGKAGSFRYAFKSNARGLLIVQVRTAQGSESHRILRSL